MPKLIKERKHTKAPEVSDYDRINRTEERARMKLHGVASMQELIGVDEAGLGSLFGCFLTAACIVPESVVLKELNDSKKLSEKERERLFEKIVETPGIIYHYHVTERDEVDRVGVYQANHDAMVLCIEQVLKASNAEKRHVALIDGNKVPKHLTACLGDAIVKGDAK